jgi:hypothetical protein
MSTQKASVASDLEQARRRPRELRLVPARLHFHPPRQEALRNRMPTAEAPRIRIVERQQHLPQ